MSEVRRPGMSRRQFLHVTAGATAGAAVAARAAVAQPRPKTGGTFISAKMPV